MSKRTVQVAENVHVLVYDILVIFIENRETFCTISLDVIQFLVFKSNRQKHMHRIMLPVFFKTCFSKLLDEVTTFSSIMFSKL